MNEDLKVILLYITLPIVLIIFLNLAVILVHVGGKTIQSTNQYMLEILK